MKFALKELRKYFDESDLKEIDQQSLMSRISKGATLMHLKLHITEVLVGKKIKPPSRPPLQ